MSLCFLGNQTLTNEHVDRAVERMVDVITDAMGRARR